MQQDDIVHRLRKAVEIVARRLRNDDGNYDLEATWTIGIMSTVAEMELEDLEKATETYSRITFTFPGDKKIPAIKIVRTHLECGLKEGKEIVEGIRHANASPAVANLIKEECERDCGSSVIVRPWQQNYYTNPVIGRGLDLSDDDPDAIPF